MIPSHAFEGDPATMDQKKLEDALDDLCLQWRITPSDAVTDVHGKRYEALTEALEKRFGVCKKIRATDEDGTDFKVIDVKY